MPRTKAFCEKEVLNKATRLFWRKGFHATSIQDLVRELGINRASLYDTFGNKEALFKQAFDAYRLQGQAQVRSFLVEYADPREGIRALYQMAIDTALATDEPLGCMNVNVSCEMLPDDKALADVLNQQREAITEIFYQYLHPHYTLPEAEIRAKATYLYTLYSGLQVMAKMRPGREALEAAADVGVEVLR